MDSRLRGNDKGRRPFDMLPSSPETAGLPTSLKLRRTSRRASAGDIDGDGELTVLDIDHIIA
jgi:hypothetical protein